MISILKKRQDLNFVNDETESALSVESRSFMNGENDQVRKDRKEFPVLQEMEKNIL